MPSYIFWLVGSDIVNNLNQCYLTSSDNPTNHHIYEGIPETTATKNYIIPHDLNICNKVKDTLGPKVAVADGCIISPTKKAIIPLLKKLTEKDRLAFSCENLKSGSLISIGQLCDDDCIAIFTNYDVQIIWRNEILIRGKRTDNGLWKIPLSNNQPTLVSNTPETVAQELLKWILQKVNWLITTLQRYSIQKNLHYYELSAITR